MLVLMLMLMFSISISISISSCISISISITISLRLLKGGSWRKSFTIVAPGGYLRIFSGFADDFLRFFSGFPFFKGFKDSQGFS